MQTNLNFVWDETKTVSENVRDINYQEIVLDDERLCRTQKMVYDTLQSFGVLCDKAISEKTGLPVSSVCGRRNELVKLGLVEASPDPVEYPDYNGCIRLNTGWRVKL